MTSYTSPNEHLLDCLERVRLLLLRQLVRHWYRATDSTGTLNDLFVSFEEVRHGGATSPAGAPAERGLPGLEEIEVRLETHLVACLQRLEASADQGIRFPIEDLRAAFGLDPMELDILLLVTALQIDEGLQRLARFVWSDFTQQRPTIGFVAEVVGRTAEGILLAQRALWPDSRLRRRVTIEAFSDDRFAQVPPVQSLRLTVPDRIRAWICGGEDQYQFKNIREPQSVWKKLNPVRVNVRVKEMANPHFVITIHKKAVGAQVVAGTARLGHGNDQASPAFNPGTQVAELASLTALTPSPITFGPGSDVIPGADKTRLEFLGTYMRRRQVPKFKMTVDGHHQLVVHAPGTSTRDKRSAERAAQSLSTRRAQVVRAILHEQGATTPHRITATGRGTAGAAAAPAWDKVEIASVLFDPAWQNRQATTPHEFGHMLGLGDEYSSAAAPVGTPSSHHALTVSAFGQQYADASAKRVVDGSSLMHSGTELRPHHYVTFWDGLAQLTQAAAQPTVKFGQADWKFDGA